jgi:cell division protease FtsH
LLARAVAGEAKVPFFFDLGFPRFVEMFVGRARAAYARSSVSHASKPRASSSSTRSTQSDAGAMAVAAAAAMTSTDQTLNQLLVEIDGFDPSEGVVLIGATNRQDVLDPALLRPGRFDRRVNVGNPDLKGRHQILSVHMRKLKLATGVDPLTIARGTPGFSGADLANLVNEAALIAARRGARKCRRTGL